MKYADGYVNEPPDKMAQEVDYPEWWKREGYFRKGPKVYGKKTPLSAKWYKAQFAPGGEAESE